MDEEDLIDSRSNMSEERQEGTPRTMASINSEHTNMQSNSSDVTSDVSSEEISSDEENDKHDGLLLSDTKSKINGIEDDSDNEEEDDYVCEFIYHVIESFN